MKKLFLYTLLISLSLQAFHITSYANDSINLEPSNYFFYVPGMFDTPINNSITDAWVNAIVNDFASNYDGVLNIVKINSFQDFSDSWNGMDSEIGTIMIMIHGYATGFKIGSDYINLNEISSLSNVDANELLLISCNSGNNSYTKNPATVMSSLINGGCVYAPDGTIAGRGVENSYTLESVSDKVWTKQNRYGNIRDNKSDGYIVYKDGKELLQVGIYGGTASDLIKEARSSVLVYIDSVPIDDKLELFKGEVNGFWISLAMI